MKPKHNKKNILNIQLISALLLTIVGATLLIMGFYADPRGEIHPSIPVAYGETLSFVGTCFGIDWYHRAKSNHKSH